MKQSRNGTLSHAQFYQLTELMKTHREGVSKCYCWRQAKELLTRKAQEAGLNLPISEHSVQQACELLEVRLEGQRIPGVKRTPDLYRDEMEILARAVGRLYEKLGEPLTPGLARLVAIARRETSLTATLTNKQQN